MLRHHPQSGQGFRCDFLLATFLLLAPAAVASDKPASPEALWKKLEPFARPPREFAGKFGPYRSPLKFAGGSVARTEEAWGVATRPPDCPGATRPPDCPGGRLIAAA
jgi:hypothetical protein